jgi:uncharacterized Ntn-hydrolase superfamily protein
MIRLRESGVRVRAGCLLRQQARAGGDRGDELAGTDITVQTINPEPYDTGFNDRLADTTYRWHDDAINFTREDDIRASFRRS